MNNEKKQVENNGREGKTFFIIGIILASMFIGILLILVVLLFIFILFSTTNNTKYDDVNYNYDYNELLNGYYNYSEVLNEHNNEVVNDLLYNIGNNVNKIDFEDENLFEKQLNNGKTSVKDKTIKFVVREFHDDSILGYNCYAGEHLNFISSSNINANAGDTIIGKITKDPYKFIGSWVIEYELVSKTDGNKTNNKEKDKPEENTINNTIQGNESNIDLKKDNDNYKNEVSNNVDTNETKNSNREYYSSNDLETAKKGESGKFSYCKSGQYNIYWVIDFDEGYVYSFSKDKGENEIYDYERVKISSGNLNDGLKVAYNDSSLAWLQEVHFKTRNQPNPIILIDNDGFDYELKAIDLEETLKLMKNNVFFEP